MTGNGVLIRFMEPVSKRFPIDLTHCVRALHSGTTDATSTAGQASECYSTVFKVQDVHYFDCSNPVHVV